MRCAAGEAGRVGEDVGYPTRSPIGGRQRHGIEEGGTELLPTVLPQGLRGRVLFQKGGRTRIEGVLVFAEVDGEGE